MAEPEDIDLVREMVSESNDENGWTAERIAGYIDRSPSSNYRAASIIWSVKAGEYATAVDVAESGSSRKLSDLKKNALEMAAHYRGLADKEEEVPVVVDPTSTAPFTVAISRPRRGRSG